MTTKADQIAARLRHERTRLGLSQAALCAAGGVSKSTQVAYEAGQRVPDLLYLDGVSVVGVDPVLVATGLPARAFAAKNFDWALFNEIICAISEFEQEHHVTIPLAKLPDLVRLLFDEFSLEGAIAPDTLSRVLRLVA